MLLNILLILKYLKGVVEMSEKEAARVKAYMVQVIRSPTLNEEEQVEKMCEFIDKVVKNEKMA